jgi:hypothetical protein
MAIFRKGLFVSTIVMVVASAGGFATPASAGVNVNINLGPPPIVAAEPPDLVMVPQTGVFFVPDRQLEVFFYGGYWWSLRGATWYRARAYNGPWGVIARPHVPRALIYMPRDYRGRYERERRIPYGQWKREHSRWERDNRKAQKRWEKDREKEYRARERQGERNERRQMREDHRPGNGPERHGGPERR